MSNKNILHYLSNIVNNIPHYIFWKDDQLIFKGCNQNFATSLGFNKADNIIGLTDFDMPWPREQSAKYRADDLEIIKTGLPKLDYEEIQIQPDKTEKIVLVSKVPMFDDNGSIIGILGIYTDITERKKMEEHLRIAKEQAEENLRVKEEFIRNMEHDIRTPFVGIWGVADYLYHSETDDTKKACLADIVASSKELMDFCDTILNFAKMSNGSLPLLEKKFDLQELIESTYKIQKPAASHKNLEFILEYDTNLPKFLINDAYRIQRILVNLLSNAIKFTHKGYVKLQVKGKKLPKKRIWLINFCVEDTGIGIPEDKQEFIFEKFSRLNAANKMLYRGIGLGLRIVKEFVNELDGDIELYSKNEEGTQFNIIIPCKEPYNSD